MIIDGNMKLFRYGDNQWVTCDDIRKALLEVHAEAVSYTHLRAHET